jgi:hypothetical protein
LAPPSSQAPCSHHGFASRHRCSCLLVGLARGFIPELREIQLPSETVLLLFHSIQPE